MQNIFAQSGGNAWIFLPATDFGTAMTVLVKVAARPADVSLQEGFEVFVGSNSTVEAMTTKVMEKVWSAGTFTDEDYEDGFEICQGNARVDGGVNFIGIHVLSGDTADSNKGVYFHSVSVADNSTVAVSEIESDPDAPVEYYSLQGVRIANPEKGSIVIVRQGGSAHKTVIR